MATRWASDWSDRPSEEAALYNPAFCGELIARAVTAYIDTSDRPFPLPLAFVILPLTLAPALRDQLPGRSNTMFGNWASQHEPMLAEIADRILALRPVTREALLFMAQHHALAISPRGIAPGASPMKLAANRSANSDDLADMQRSARMLGRWFANQGNVGALLLAMGVRP